MSGPLRSKRGCWTCRLRRKKCDEGTPCCTICLSLSIACYGYGSKPEWMDGGPKEKEIVKDLKETVKQTWRQKGSAKFPRHRSSAVRLAPKITKDSKEVSLSSSPPDLEHFLPPSSKEPLENVAEVKQDGSTGHLPSKQSKDPGSQLTVPFSAYEIGLAMHFLNEVLPLEFPFYNPMNQTGGRGWLLNIALRMRPLFHAIQAISAHHLHAHLSVKTGDSQQATAALIHQEENLETCLKLMSQSAQGSCPKKNMGLAITVIQLMFLELFTGRSNAWQAHVQAMTVVYIKGSEHELGEFGLGEKARDILNGNLPLPDDDDMALREVTAFRFLSGVTVWLDIVSSITTGKTPRLLHHHSRLLTLDCQTKLQDIVGCRNWVAFQIGRIATLHNDRVASLQRHGTIDAALERTAIEINEDLMVGFGEKARPHDPTSAFQTNSDSVTTITHVYWCMALCYLHLVTQGFRNLEDLGASIVAAKNLMKAQATEYVLPALVCPLFIIGVVAGPEDESFIRQAFSSPRLLDPSIRHREKILTALEVIWGRRRAGPDLVWGDCLALTQNILLV